MSSQKNRMRAFAPVLGMILGAGAGLITEILASWNTAIAISIGAGLGLVIGSVVYSFEKSGRSK